MSEASEGLKNLLICPITKSTAYCSTKGEVKRRDKNRSCCCFIKTDGIKKGNVILENYYPKWLRYPVCKTKSLCVETKQNAR